MKTFFKTVCIIFFAFYMTLSSNAFCMPGSYSKEVEDVQKRLSQLGIYSENADGIYSYSLADSVKKFQKRNGISADGVCTSTTLSKLGVDELFPLKNEDEIIQIARFAESFNTQNIIEMLSICAVVQNRLESPLFSDSCHTVIKELEKYCGVTSSPVASLKAYRCAFESVLGADPTFEATYFSSQPSRWVADMEKTVSYGNFTFYKFSE